MKISIIGGGNFGTAIAEGLLAAKFSKAKDITITRRKTELLEDFANRGVQVTSNNAAAVKNAGLVLLAVKPYQVAEVMAGITPVLSSCLLYTSPSPRD